MPRGAFEALQRSGGISELREWPAFGIQGMFTEYVLRSRAAVELFNSGIIR